MTTTLAVAASAAVAAPLAFAATTTPDYRKLIVQVGKQKVQATVGSYCIPDSSGTGRCVDATYPLKTTGKVTVKRGGSVTLLFGAPMGTVHWQTARISGGKERATADGPAKLATRTKKRWTFTLPKNVRTNSTVLRFLAVAPNAYATFEVGLKVTK